ncbi:MAG: TIGR03769 domain-containing protein [Chthoniobacterales bacterium]
MKKLLLILLAAERAASGYTVVTDQHIDIVSIDYSAAHGLTGAVHADSGDSSPVDTLLYDGPTGTTSASRPSGSQWDFLGVTAGQPIYFWPQTSLPGRIYAGFEAQSIPTGTFASWQPADSRITGAARWLEVRLLDVNYFDLSGNPGDADFSLWTTGQFSSVTVWMASSDGIGANDAFYVTEGGHAHTNWGFSKAGYYQITFELGGYLASDPDTWIESAPTTWHFGVEFQPSAIPEPSGWALGILGLAVIGVARRFHSFQTEPKN